VNGIATGVGSSHQAPPLHRPDLIMLHLRRALLWLLTLAFMARVMGQILVGIYQPSILPSWSEWYSGLLPYPWLLLSQFLLLMFMAVVNTDNWRAQGTFYVQSATARRWLMALAGIYAACMITRYGFQMMWQPDQRWFGGTIPIIFHLVLAAWMLTLTWPGALRKTIT